MTIFGGPQKAALTVEATSEAITFDASVREGHRKSAVITAHPVEEGADISDHIQRERDSLEVNVIVTNDPPIILASARALPISGFSDPNSRAEDAYEFLSRVINRSQTVGFSTTFRSYSNMGIAALSADRDAPTGNIANINMTLTEVPIATTEMVAPPVPVNPGRKGKDNNGKKPASNPTSAVQEKSRALLARIFTATGKALGF
jgi:hypothetical protein